jgi:simple sugar transport system permease protein
MKYEHILLVIFVITFAVFGILSPDRFLGLNNLQTMLVQLPEFAILALGMMVVILTGGINLSIAATSALCGIVAALFLTAFPQDASGMTFIILGTVLAGLLFAILTGLFNGTLVAFVGVTPILVTIGARAVFKGLGLVMTKGGSVSSFPESFYFIGSATPLGIPLPLYIFLVVAIITYFLVHRTPWGARVFMIGSNAQAANFSGVPVRRILLQVYIYSSLLAGVAALIMISRYNSAKVTLGTSYLLQTVAASVLGGTSIYGGRGNVLGVILAAAILQIISSGLNILGVNRFLIEVSLGAILILALTINFLATTNRLPDLRKLFGGSRDARAVDSA